MIVAIGFSYIYRVRKALFYSDLLTVYHEQVQNFVR